MLLDLALWLATPAPWRHRRLGYVRESVLLSGRARRCRRAWAPHAARSRDAVLTAFADLARRREAVVLGSGPLADVPLSQLAAAFERVVLVDAVHPLSARLAARRLSNVRLVTADLAGAGDPVGALCGRADLTVSVNLLTQLPVVPMDRHEARGLAEPERLGAEIVAGHLAALGRLPGRVCLVTDTAQREEDRGGPRHRPARPAIRCGAAPASAVLGLGARPLRRGRAPPAAGPQRAGLSGLGRCTGRAASA